MSTEPTTQAADQPPTPAKPRGRRPRAVAPSTAGPVAPTAPANGATIPATDAANPDIPLKLSPDAIEGTRDRATAFAWMEEGYVVRKRNDGVFEHVHVTAGAEPVPEQFEHYPDVEQLDRRLLNPTLHTDVTILFTDELNIRRGHNPRYYKRWIDTQVPSRLLMLTQRGGYRKAEWSMLADKNEIGDRVEDAKDPYVRRGKNGRYMLLFMPYAKWLEIKTAQARLRTKNERTNMAEMAARQLGPQAADVLTTRDDQGRPGLIGSIKELPPQSLESFQSSGLPKDIATGEGVALLDE